jgi:hypothetical protein
MAKKINYTTEVGGNGKTYIYCNTCGMGLLLHGGFQTPPVDVKKEVCFWCDRPYTK